MKHQYVMVGIAVAVVVLLVSAVRGSYRLPGMTEGLTDPSMSKGAGANGSVVCLVAPSWRGWSKKFVGEVGGSGEKLQGALEGSGLGVSLVDDKSQEGKALAAKHGTNGYPATIVLDKNGEKKKVISGFKPLDKLVDEIKGLF